MKALEEINKMNDQAVQKESTEMFELQEALAWAINNFHKEPSKDNFDALNDTIKEYQRFGANLDKDFLRVLVEPIMRGKE